jgi:hypothetical protein
MGLAWSAENILSWRSQYDRIKRWSVRLREFGSDEMDQERLDFYLAFFLNCYSLRDWLINSNAIPRSDLDELIQSSVAMCVCRDLCNRSKHLILNNPSADKDFSIVREYTPNGNRFFIVVFDKSHDLFEIAVACIQFWSDFLTSHKLPEPKNSFA